MSINTGGVSGDPDASDLCACVSGRCGQRWDFLDDEWGST